MLYNFYYFSIKSMLAVIIFSLLSVSQLFASGTGTLQGKVYDKQTKEELVGANLIIKNSSIGAATDLYGNFIIYNIPEGVHELDISYIGYNTMKVNITVKENEIVKKNFYLEAKSITGQTIVVTAQAQGQLSAINQQLSSNTIENVVSKDRIKELPDVNAAESIGRLPGISIERSGGEANKVEIRGLDPKYSLITVNGVTLPGTGSTDRSVDLSLISSNMLDGITVKKVVTPDMDADVLGGTVDLRLKDAPDSLVFNASGQGGYNQLQKYYKNYNFNISASNRFLDNSLGIIANLNADNYDRSADKLQANYTGVGNSSAITQTDIMELQLREEKVDRKRTGASLLMDYLIPNGKINANGFFNQLNWNGQYNINDMWTPDAPYNTNRHFYQLEQTGGLTNIFTSALGVKQDFSWIKYDASISKSGSYSNTPNDRVWEFDQESAAFPVSAITPQTMTTDIPKIAYIDTNKTQLANMYIYNTRVMENHTAANLNLQLPFRVNDQINGFFKTGAKFHWVQRSNNQNQVGENGLNYGNTSAANAQLSILSKAYPQWNIDALAKTYGGLPITQFLINENRTNFLNGDYPLGFIMNQSMMNNLTDALKTSNQWLTYSIGTLGHDYSGSENYQAGYIMGEFNITKYFILIPGVRWEGENTVYNGLRYREITINNQEGPPADLTYLSTTRNNSFWLPMVNLIAKPTDWLQVKLARTETLAHPDYIEYAPITYISADQSQITAANSNLQTSLSTNYDGEVSVYQNSVGYLSVDGFYKKINNLIFYSAFKLAPGLTPPQGLNIPLNWYASSTPQVNTYLNNPNPATYYGFELDWQTHFWYLPTIFQGLVLNLNYTHIFSRMELQYDSLVTKVTGRAPRLSFSYSYVPREVTTRMPDQPSNIANVTLGYDLGGFSIRLSYLFQADKLTGIGYAGIYPSNILSSYTGQYERWDVTLQQKFDKHLQIFVNLNNLNGRPDRNFTGSALTNPAYLEYYGFTMDLGVRYNL